MALLHLLKKVFFYISVSHVTEVTIFNKMVFCGLIISPVSKTAQISVKHRVLNKLQIFHNFIIVSYYTQQSLKWKLTCVTVSLFLSSIIIPSYFLNLKFVFWVLFYSVN